MPILSGFTFVTDVRCKMEGEIWNGGDMDWDGG